MNRKFTYKIFIIILFFQPFLLKSQDLIILKNSVDTIKCKIQEDKIIFLKYTKYNSVDTTIYQINQNEFDYYILQPKENIEVKTNNIIQENIQPVVYENKSVTDTLQNNFKPTPHSKVFLPNYNCNLGFGYGIDYGGVAGVRFTYYPKKYFSAFIAGGYALVDMGYNIGLSLHIYPNQKICPYFSVMYGYNSIIKVFGAPEYDKVYYGPSISFGFEIRSRKMKNYLNIELLYLLRSKNFQSDLASIKMNRSIRIISTPPPIGFSIGYHFAY